VERPRRRGPRGHRRSQGEARPRDAQYAIDYAYAAVEEAEYAVLNAELARMDADALEAVA
jgi:hypothetical protein